MSAPKISNIQVFWMTFSMECAMNLFSTQSSVIQNAKQDAWISFLVGGAIACGTTLLSRALSIMYPEQTLFDFSTKILGRWLGKIIIVPFVIMWIVNSGALLRQFSDFFQMILFDRTPTGMLMFLMMVIVVFLVCAGGIEGIGRCSQLMGPIILLIIVLIILLSFKNYEFEQILPIFSDSGVKAIMQGGLAPASVLGDTVFLLMVTKFMENPRQGTKLAVWAVTSVAVISSVLTLTALAVFGPALASKMLFPTFEMIRFVTLMEFIQNIEIFSSILWFLSVFIKLSLYVFVACYGMSQWLGLKRKTISIYVIAPAVFLLAWKLPQAALYTNHIQVHLGVHYVMPIELIGIPFMLWLIGTVRKRYSHQ
ncbi:endospore germination permease [Paenibacillus sp. Y412MC10]|uniref:GerAB/ArcD/ProY family transporter n=1 Tax=Geobacillus sp. (strain Y412MC10) TaxID=481743 RepID=UPI0011AB884F|nr:endospore germination permease [Paenibacillus sp. Y412MC10]